jgi:predicted DNA-binding protein with PD1-like motif
MNSGRTFNKGETMLETMTQDTKDRIANLERQKIELNDQLEILGYTGNLVRMHQIEEQIYEIDDTIAKLIG